MAVPVTLKIRTGPNPARRNAARIARIAESAGVQLLSIHGRTRACGFGGEAEYETIAAVKSAVRIPVIANGDLEAPQDVARVLAQTGADGVMIGRAAHGRPWIFREIEHYLAHGTLLPGPGLAEVRDLLLEHLDAMYALYGSELGARIARKHVGWYARALPGGEALKRASNCAADAASQLAAVRNFFEPALRLAA